MWRKRKGFLSLVQLFMGFAVVYLPAFLWQWSYFGDPLPNTYYAKTGAGWIQFVGGWDYLVRSLAEVAKGSGWLPLLAFLALRKPQGQRLYLLFMLATVSAIVVLEGGDHFPGARFLVPALPLLFALVVIGLSNLTQRIGGVGRAGLLGAAIVLAIAAFNPAEELQVKPAWARLPRADPSTLEYQDKYWVANFPVMGKALREIAAPGQSIAVVPIGAIGYFSDLKVIDMVGITDPYIAHQPFDPAYVGTWLPGHDKGDGLYVLSRRPDFIQLVTRLTSQPRPGVDTHGEQYKSVVEIWNAAEFQQDYEFHPVQVESGWYYNLYKRRTDLP